MPKRVRIVVISLVALVGRVSPHHYNTTEEIDRLLESL